MCPCYTAEAVFSTPMGVKTPRTPLATPMFGLQIYSVLAGTLVFDCLNSVPNFQGLKS